MAEEYVRTTEDRLCESLAQVLGLDPRAVGGTARLEELLERGRRMELWKEWERVSMVRLPRLDHSMAAKMGWFAGGFVAALFALTTLRTMGVYVPGSTMVGGVVGVLLGAVGLRLFGGQGVEFPAGVHTVADLAMRVEMRKD